MSKYLKGHGWSSAHVQWSPVRNLQSEKTEPHSKGLERNVRRNIRQKFHCLQSSDPFSHKKTVLTWAFSQNPLHVILTTLERILKLCEKIRQILNDVTITPTVLSKESQVRASITTFYTVTDCKHCTAGRASAFQSSVGSNELLKFPPLTNELHLVHHRAQLLNYCE